jgi:2-methylcitrate dehydratase PrpD
MRRTRTRRGPRHLTPTSSSATGAATAAHRLALLDWLACACAGAKEPAARAARSAGDGPLERIAFAGAAGHVLDFDDTFQPGLSHLSAPTAPVALVLGAEVGATAGAALDAFAAGFEAMGALAEASHPALYEGGWHPTAVCGVVGAAVTAARLLELDGERERTAVGLSLLRAGGLRAAFGSDGKSLQVGLAAAAGAQAARLAAAGADVAAGVASGFEQAFGGRFAEPGDTEPAAPRNWIKAYPCCLQAHSAIEVAAAGRPGAELTVVVHPRARQAAAFDDVETGLEAKFSIPYLAAFTLLHGAPRSPDAFHSVDAQARELAAERVEVVTDPELGESEAVLLVDGDEAARVPYAAGSPQRPMSEEELAAKVRGLAGERLAGAFEDPGAPVAELLQATFASSSERFSTRSEA